VEVPEKKKIPENKEVEEIEIISDPGPAGRIILAGGDYFGQSELSTTFLEEKNPIDKFIKNNPKLNPVQQFHEEQEEKTSLPHAGDDNFMTETLAKIYADQSLYQLAIEAYEKLILLYPKKSNYFASLIQELKSKMNR
jgi:tetratricopeptide (TPR) repeat protein